MAITGRTIVSRAEYMVDDDIDTTDALEIINLGIYDLSVEAPKKGLESIALLASTRSIVVPSTCISVESVFIGSNELEELDIPFTEDQLATGTPSKFFLVENTLMLYPLSNAAQTVNLLVQKSYTPLTTLDEEPIDIPDQYRMGLVFWLLSHFKFFDDESTEASYFTKEYWRYRAALKSHQDNRSGYLTPKS
jgi:hypothetical protein